MKTLKALARATAALLPLQLAVAVAPAAARDAAFYIPTIPGAMFQVDIGTVLDRRFYSVVRQQYDFSCGSAALATLLRYHYGVPANEEMTFNGMWENGDQAAIRQKGFSLLDMKRYLQSIGLKTEGYRVTLDQVAKTQIPGIALIVSKGYRHFVVIKGVSDENVLVGDPARGLLRVPRDVFQQQWDGLYFVITDHPDTGRATFNRAGQWASVGRAPTGENFTRPVDPEVLRLAIPGILFGEL